MHIHKIQIKNFRLLSNVELALEDQTTLVVGRNNSGKTSFSEIIRRFIEDNSPEFRLEDFSNAAHDEFCEALKAKNEGKPNDEVHKLVPSIELRLLLKYDSGSAEFGPLSDFIIDLNPDCHEALIVARYELRNDAVEKLYAGQPATGLTDGKIKTALFRELRERIPKLFAPSIWAEDPNDSSNRKQMQANSLRVLLKTGFVNAQRGLDDDTSKGNDVLAKILVNIFTAAKLPSANQSEHAIAKTLQEAVRSIQEDIGGNFKNQLQQLMPTLEDFGYPGLEGNKLETETMLDVERLLSNHTKVKYTGYHGISLPESYTGLGIRNLVFILLRLISFHRAFCAEEIAPRVHLVFIEEPEAHMHPQMQEVFIRQISKIAQQLREQEGASLPWPVQFIVSTHSSHVANAANFESIRYFLPTSEVNSIRKTKVKDLRQGMHKTCEEHKKFLSRYLTLTRCDLFFADKAVLVEGTSERLLLPPIIKKLEAGAPNEPNFSSQYLTIMEVGGAYAHKFFDLLDFLELRTLIITDLDSIDARGRACPVHEGEDTSNSCLKKWFGDGDCSLVALLKKDAASKTKGLRRIAFQQPEMKNGPCGRTFEDAFMLTNSAMFGIEGAPDEQENTAWGQLNNLKNKKSEFALKYAIDQPDWHAPNYILDGLKWLANSDTADAKSEAAQTTNNASETTVANDG